MSHYIISAVETPTSTVLNVCKYDCELVGFYICPCGKPIDKDCVNELISTEDLGAKTFDGVVLSYCECVPVEEQLWYENKEDFDTAVTCKGD